MLQELKSEGKTRIERKVRKEAKGEGGWRRRRKCSWVVLVNFTEEGNISSVCVCTKVDWYWQE